MVSFLGTGLLGANFTRALLKRGEKVHVWNRTAEKARALESDGAKAFENVADAVKGAARVHLTLSDDKSVDDVLDKAASGLSEGTIIVDHTTTSASGALKRHQYWKQKGIHYLHAPVFMGPPNALEGTGTMMISGDQNVIRQVEGELSKMTGRLWNLGDQPEKAAAIKLLGNLFHIVITGGVSDLMSLATSLNVPHSELNSLLEVVNPTAVSQARIRKISSKTFDQPSWELSMARKDARLMMEQSGSTKHELIVVPAVAARMDKWIEKGFGANDWTILASETKANV